MSLSSHAVSRLRESYRVALHHMRELNARMFAAPQTVLSHRQPCSVEQLEPRLMLSGTSGLVSTLADVVAADVPAAATDTVPNGRVNSLVYTRSIELETGLPDLNHELDFNFEASLVDDITLHLPWGETTLLSDHVPADWAGEYFETEIEQGPWWMEIVIESLGTNPDPELDTYRYEFAYGVESTPVDLDAWWQAVDVVPTEAIVDFPVGANWSTLLGFDGVPMPDTAPQAAQPLPFASVDSLRPTIEWTPWSSPLDLGIVSLWFEAEDADDSHGGWWGADVAPSDWTPDRDLLPGQAYEYELDFHNQAFDSSTGTSVNRTSARQLRQYLTVDVTPGSTVDLRADDMQANAATVEAGGYIPAWIEVTNTGSDPVSFPWRIVLSSDTTPDPSDLVVVSETMAFGAGAPMAGGGQVYVPATVGAGTYQMILVLDPDNLVAETDETNNYAVSTPFTVTVPANFTPVAVLDVFQCDRNDSLTLSFADLVANDIDLDDDPFSVVSVTEIGQTHGTLQVVGDQITYTPEVDYHGPARFEYTVRDSAGLEATAVANISVVWIPDGLVHYLMYTRTIDWDAGVPDPSHGLAVRFEASLADEVTISLPWGETVVFSDYLPADWAGEAFETEIDLGQRWLELCVEPRRTASYPRLGTYWYELEYDSEQTGAELDAWWQAVDIIPTEILVEFPVGNGWSTLLDFDGVPMPDATPELVQPLPFAVTDSPRPTIDWMPWTTAPQMGVVGLWLEAEGADDNHGNSWDADLAVSAWAPSRDLLDGQAYEYGVAFRNQVTDSSSGMFMDTTSSRQSKQYLTVDVGAAGVVDPRADAIVGNAATVEAGGYLSGRIEMINAGSDPVSFPWRIVLSSDTTPDPSDRLIVSTVLALGAGETMGGEGQSHIPGDMAPGTYHMILVLDPDDLVSEADETNNLVVSAPFTITVPANRQPIAVLDVFQCDRNDPLVLSSGDLLANDIEYDGDLLVVVAVTPTDQTHGTLQFVGDQITYTPDVNYYGPTRFEYTVRDPGGLEATAVVNVSVEESGGYVYTVNSLGDQVNTDGVVTLREALAAANANAAVTNDVQAGSDVGVDRIVFDLAALQAQAGVGNPLVIGDSGLVLEDDIRIVGPGDDVLTIDAGQADRLLHVGDAIVEAVVSGVTLTGGRVDHFGGAVYTAGLLTLSDVTVGGSSVTHPNGGYGGGIYNTGTLTLTDSTVSGNMSTTCGGGIYNDGGTVVLTGSTVSGNSATGTWANGAGIYNDEGAVTLTDSTVSGNTAAGTGPDAASGYSRGGGIYNDSGTVTLAGSTVSDNRATGTGANGGGIYNDDGPLAMTNSTVSDNRTTGATSEGGGIVSSGRLTLTDVTLSGNSAVLFGGGLSLRSGVVSLLRVNVTENSAAFGGGIRNATVLTVTESEITDNTAANSGGGVYSWGGELTLEGAAVSGNTASEEGGGIHNRSMMALDSVEISDNHVSGVDAYGGGLFNQSPATLRDVTITGNSTTASRYSRGGGIFNGGAGGVMTVTNATVSGNASHGGDGGGINNSGGTLTLANTVVRSNIATGSPTPGGLQAFGGGIMNLYQGVVTLTNSTVAGNRSIDNHPLAGGLYSDTGCTLTMNNTIVAVNFAPGEADLVGAWTGGGNVLSADPGFVRNPSPGVDGRWGTVDDVPGDLHLTATSPAVALGSNALAVDGDGLPLTTDLDGQSRIVGGQVDAGAYEYQGAVVALTWDGSDPAEWTTPHWNPGPVVCAGGEAMVVDSGRVMVASDLTGVPGAAASLDIALNAPGGTVSIGGAGRLAVTGDVSVGEGGTLSNDGVLIAGWVNVVGGVLTNSPGSAAPARFGTHVALSGGGTFVADAVGAGVDRLVTDGAVALGADASLEILIRGGGGEFVAGTYVLIAADEGLTGTFDNVRDLGAYVSAGPNGDGLTYNAGGTVMLTLDKDLNPADANLDGQTDVSDRIVWNNNNFTFGTTFTTGDWNNDGRTDVSDRIIWNNNNFTFASATPQPQAAPAAQSAPTAPDDTNDMPAAPALLIMAPLKATRTEVMAVACTAPAGETTQATQPTSDDATGLAGVDGVGDEVRPGFGTGGSGHSVTLGDTAAELEVDLGVGLVSPLGL